MSVVVSNLTEFRLLFRHARCDVRRIRSQLNDLGAMLAVRQEGFEKIRASVGRRVRGAFSVILHTRGYQGSLRFCHGDARLEVVVDPEGYRAFPPGSGKSRGMKTLSGGEKSYSTVALILALWEVMMPPFRFLDEFDVFMDAMNRRMAVEQIKDHATRIKRHQFVLLTPLNLQNIEVDEDTRVIKLEKNQR